MATTNTTVVPVDPDTQITVKVSFQGGIRRFRLPLRELGPAVLPGKLRQSLSIPDGVDVKFERYSDSAASFVVLDPNVPSVYKQLYRAAKAKLKLRLRATLASDENAKEIPPTYSEVSLPYSAPQSIKVEPQSPTTKAALSELSNASSEIDQAVAEAVKRYFSSDSHEENLREKVKQEVERQSRASSVIVPEETVKAEAPVQDKNITYMVCCNNCDKSITGTHYHCGTCDGGDYDICLSCRDEGVHCRGDHWLIERRLDNGQFVDISSTPTFKKPVTAPMSTRTCNCCVTSLPEECFVTCTECPDYDVCLPCHIEKKHGHHPAHGFMPATQDTPLDAVGTALLAPGRGTRHNAICDGCHNAIYGVRNKCFDCPDWDFCSQCYISAPTSHPGHRFVSLYESISPPNPMSVFFKSYHRGIFCDGPLCKDNSCAVIYGDRYKCAVCDDTDFCAACEAHPSNTHNRTHPLIKIKTPIRHISCTTHDNNSETVLGDRFIFGQDNTRNRETSHAATQVQTVANVEPTPEEQVEQDVKSEDSLLDTQVPVLENEPLEAEFFSDTVDDATVMKPGQKFSQTWILKNAGKSTWPVGISVKFVGGDKMFGGLNPDEASKFTTPQVVEPGDFAAFSVDLVAPEVTQGRVISYWRLTAPDGIRFGHKIWCDIMVDKKENDEDKKANEEKDRSVSENDVKSLHGSLAESVSSSTSSEMVFPKLEKESMILNPDAAASTDTVVPSEDESSVRSGFHSPAWTLTMSEEEGHGSDNHTSEDDVDSLMLDEEDYEVLETSDDDGYNKVI